MISLLSSRIGDMVPPNLSHDMASENFLMVNDPRNKITDMEIRIGIIKVTLSEFIAWMLLVWAVYENDDS